MSKKLLSIILCLVLTFALTGCSIKFKLPDNLFDSSAPQDANTILGGILEKIPFVDSDNLNIASPSVILPDAPKTEHTPISRENYYQYSLLNDTEKQIYNDICKAIETQQNYINVKKYKLNDTDFNNTNNSDN